MRFNRLLALSGFGVFATACALPLNASTDTIGDNTVQTAGNYDPKNIASDAWWTIYSNKGSHYQCLFKANDEEAGRLIENTGDPPTARSRWEGSMYAERFIWNWHENWFDDDNCNFEYLHLKDAFDALELNAYCIDDEEHTGHNVGWSLGHYDEHKTGLPDSNSFSQMTPPVLQTYTVGEQTYKSTGGYYTFVVNQNDGAIIALDMHSPMNAIKHHWKDVGGENDWEGLPSLQYGSDLMWGKWVEGNEDVKKLRVYAVHNVLNDETTALVSRAMSNKVLPNLITWPGAVFNAQTDPTSFQALLGSPIGGTIAIMLAQHKAELGNKEVYQINVVSDEKSVQFMEVTELHMFFQIRDVLPVGDVLPKPEEGEKEEGGGVNGAT
ncbi:hypothetical protein OPT61_g4073 [Boeremia exigua]|uniref:Uncharacterized protein n=1 Tax=Boeremia exigua TaxID=749465 RepID=A0ACC2IFJ4_9PLEO|nr:hypothetical protein OPT61_g4073 [Boeremia exigua]